MGTHPDLLDDDGSMNGKGQRLPLSQQAYLHIRRKIISLELAPGAIISEGDLRKELGLGRTPIREALLRLSQEKLVNMVPRRGTFVAEIGITDLQRLFEIRIVLERLAAELAAIRGTGEIFKRMGDVLAPLAEEGDPVDNETLITIDEAFHKLIYRAADNKFLFDTLTTLYTLSLRLWYLSLPQMGVLNSAVREHHSILDAIKKRDAALASQLLTQHIRTFQEEIQAAMLGVSTLDRKSSDEGEHG